MTFSKVPRLSIGCLGGAGLGSAFGFAVLTAAVLKTWWDSRVNLVSGLTLFVALTLAYFVIRQNRNASR